MKIITVTLNPCIDADYVMNTPFCAGKLNRTEEPAISYNGKGINVSRVLKRLGEDSCLMTLAPNKGGEEMVESLLKEGLSVCAVRSEGRLRRNTSVLDSLGVQTQINEPGSPVGEDVLRQVTAQFKSELNCPDKKVAVLCGSLPPGADSDFYRKLCVIAQNSGAYVIADCDGENLKSVMKAQPDMIKPNEEEFLSLTGKKFSGRGEEKRIEAVRAALAFYRDGGTAVLCTLGEDGSVFAGPEGSYMCQARKTNIKKFKGAGDSFLAAYIYEHIVCDKDCDMAMMLAGARSADYLAGIL